MKKEINSVAFIKFSFMMLSLVIHFLVMLSLSFPGLCADKNFSPAVQKSLQKVISEAVKSSGAAGAVALIRTRDFTWSAAAGLANRGKGIPMKSEHCLRIASVTKTFVATVTLMLCEEGKLRLDSPARKFFPATIVEWIPNASKVTIRQLLGMISGIQDYTDQDDFFDAVEKNPGRDSWTAVEALSFLRRKPALFAPGKGYFYSNSNYLLLELAIENATGKKLAAVLRDKILDPLKLSHTYLEKRETPPDEAILPSSGNSKSGNENGLKTADINKDIDLDLDGVALPIPSWEPEWEPIMAPFEDETATLLVRGYEGGEDVTDIDDGLGMGDGGLISTAADLANFAEALFVERKLLKKESFKEMTSFNSAENYGLGLEKRNTPWGEVWAHSGNSSGFQSDMIHIPGRRTTIVILSNTFGTDIDEKIFTGIMKIIEPSNKNIKTP